MSLTQDQLLQPIEQYAMSLDDYIKAASNLLYPGEALRLYQLQTSLFSAVSEFRNREANGRATTPPDLLL